MSFHMVNPYCRNIVLNFVVRPEHGERPFFVDPAYWASAKGMAVLCGYENGTGELVITANNLVPLGVYTAWFVTDGGPYPAVPKNSTFTGDGFDPNRLIVNSRGQLQYYITHLNYNPFVGIPANGRILRINSIVIALHTDNTTHGLRPGPHVEHIAGNV